MKPFRLIVFLIAAWSTGACSVDRLPLSKMEACVARGLAESQGGPIRCDVGTNQRVFAMPGRPLTSEETAHLGLSDAEVRVLLGGWLERQGRARFCTAAETQTPSGIERSTACAATNLRIETATVASGPVIELDVYRIPSGTAVLRRIRQPH